MKKTKKIFFYTFIVLITGWAVLTLVVQKPGPKRNWDFGNSTTSKKVLIVFDPDPFYNLDEQVCLAVAQVLADSGFNVKVTSVSAAYESNPGSFDAYVFCANTYNWAPGWELTRFIKHQKSLNRKPVVAIALGAGTTMTS
jgi:hypothetical protein